MSVRSGVPVRPAARAFRSLGGFGPAGIGPPPRAVTRFRAVAPPRIRGPAARFPDPDCSHGTVGRPAASSAHAARRTKTRIAAHGIRSQRRSAHGPAAEGCRRTPLPKRARGIASTASEATPVAGIRSEDGRRTGVPGRSGSTVPTGAGSSALMPQDGPSGPREPCRRGPTSDGSARTQDGRKPDAFARFALSITRRSR